MTFTISGLAAIYVAIIVIIGKVLKPLLVGKKLGKVELTKLLPVFLLIVGEVLTIVGAIVQHTDIWTAIVSGVLYTGVAVLGYDSIRGAMSKGVKSE